MHPHDRMLRDVRIQRLPTEVINRIAAGEVVQRPSAALKELLENALDAGATGVQVVAQEGGLDVLQVSDDGCGIPYDDLPLLCERYATSKLRQFEDLQAIASFGFRGEALAALSFASRVTATTRPRPRGGEGGADLAWRCRYVDGRLVGGPEPCAANHGTTIRAEKMFYHASLRRAALRPVEEWSRLVDVVSRYALAFPAVGFSCRKEASSRAGDGVSFPKGSSTLNNIRLSHGSGVASNLRFIFHYDEELYEASKRSDGLPRNGEPPGGGDGPGEVPGSGGASPNAPASLSSMSTGETMGPGHDRKHRVKEQAMARVRKVSEYVASLSGPLGEGAFTLMGYTSDSNLLSRKGYFCLFINQRLVESAAIRRAIEAVYASVLTGGNRPFTVLFVNVPPDRLDVNVHPTKMEVYLLDEEIVIGRVTELIRVALLEAASERQVDLMSLGKTTTLALQATARAADAAGKEASSSTMLPSSQTALHSLQREAQTNKACAGAGGVPISLASVGAVRVTDPRIVAAAPCTMVRVEPQKGALDAFFRSQPTQPMKASSSDVGFGSARFGLDGATASAPDVESRQVEGAAPDSLGTGLETETTGLLPTAGSDSAPSTHSPSLLSQPSFNALPLLSTKHNEEAASGILESPLKGSENNGCVVHIRDPEDDGADDDDDDDDHKIMLEFKKFRQELGTQKVHMETPPTPSATQFDMSCCEERKCFQKDEGGVHEAHLEACSHLEGKYLAVSSGPRLGAAEPFDNVQCQPISGREVMQNTMTSSKRIEDKTTEMDADPSHVAIAPELEDHVLTSVGVIAKEICSQTSAAVQSLVDGLSFVGMVDEDSFLAQYKTSLLLVRTLPLVREVVYQRIFLRWAQSSLPCTPLVFFAEPVCVEEALLFALRHDTLGMVPPSQGLLELLRVCVANECGTEGGSAEYSERSSAEWLALINRVSSREEDKHGHFSTNRDTMQVGNIQLSSPNDGKQPLPHDDVGKSNYHERDFISEAKVLMATAPSLMWDSAQAKLATEKYVCRLVRHLSFWRDMLNDYFGIVLTDDARYLMALPYGLNTSWAPCMRAVPLFLWLLADAVPYSSPAPPRRGGDAHSANAVDENRFSHHEREVEAEIKCFTSIARHIADILYGLVVPTEGELDGEVSSSSPDGVEAACESGSCKPGNLSRPDSRTSARYNPTRTREDVKENTQEGGSTFLARLSEYIRFGLFPCMRNNKLFIPPADLLTKGDIQSVVTVETLYKVFERC